jgi:hypothetical protein
VACETERAQLAEAEAVWHGYQEDCAAGDHSACHAALGAYNTVVDLRQKLQQCLATSPSNSWTSVAGIPSGFNPDTMILLTDGSVLIHNAYGKDWRRLTPDSRGRYESGTWSSALTMANTRQFFASGVLMDGRVFAIGGEYSDAGNPTPLAEIFDPVTNSWSALAKPAAYNFINSDAVSCVLTDGRVLLGSPNSNRTAIWDPANGTWIEAGLASGTVPTKVGNTNEETWALLPDGTVLTVQIVGVPAAEKYVPAMDRWVSAGNTPGALTMATITDPVTTTVINVSEIGPALALPDGRCFFVGGTGRTALYTSAADPMQPGTWTAGPNLPADTSSNNYNSANGNLQTVLDGPATLLPNGNVLGVAGNTVRQVNGPAIQFWSNPCNCYLYNVAANTITSLTPQPPNNAVDVWRARLLGLPTGQVLLSTQQANMLEMLTIDPAVATPDLRGRPSINTVPAAFVSGCTYVMTGTQFNGLSQGSSYGDDAGVSTNYPIVRLRNAANGTVVFLRSFGFSSMGIATGSALQTTSVQVPRGVPIGQYDIVTIANGIPSEPVSVRVPVPEWAAWSSLGASGDRLRTIAAARNADGRLEAFGTAGNDTIWHNWQISPGGGWAGWTSLGAPGDRLRTIAAATNADGRLEAFGTAGNETIWHSYQVSFVACLGDLVSA